MNLLCLDSESNQLFVGCDNKVLCFSLSDVLSSESPQPQQILETNAKINQMKVHRFNNIPLLISVNEGHSIVLHFINNLQSPPIIINNDETTWGISGLSRSSKLIVSANSHKATLFSLENELIETHRVDFVGHEHNVPCVAVSPDDQFLLSVSVDDTARVWDIERAVELKKIGLPEWGWGCVWIDRSTIRDVIEEDQVTSSIRALLGESPDGNHVVNKLLVTPDVSNRKEDVEMVLSETSSPNLPPPKTEPPKLSYPWPHTPFILPKDITKPEPSLSDKKIPNNFLILCSTFRHLYLYDKDGNQLAILFDGLPSVSDQFHSFERYSILSYIPELSAIISASQGCCAVLISRVYRNLSDMKYYIKPMVRVPQATPTSPLCGTTYYKTTKQLSDVSTREVHRLILLYFDKTTSCYDIYE